MQAAGGGCAREGAAPAAGSGRQHAASSRVLLAWEQHRDRAQRHQPGSSGGSRGMDAPVPAWRAPGPSSTALLHLEWTKPRCPHSSTSSYPRGRGRTTLPLLQSPISGRKAQP